MRSGLPLRRTVRVSPSATPTTLPVKSCEAANPGETEKARSAMPTAKPLKEENFMSPGTCTLRTLFLLYCTVFACRMHGFLMPADGISARLPPQNHLREQGVRLLTTTRTLTGTSWQSKGLLGR